MIGVNETKWDKLLRIKTSGRDDSQADQFRYPYEPTPYCVLERLAYNGYLGKKNVLIDYGCGKGRVDFYLAYQTRCRCIGIEYDDRIFRAAMINQENAVSSGRTEFVLADAVTYAVPPEADCFYFFNPFSVEIFQRVLDRIRESFYQNPRKMLFFFYYPSTEYMSCLMTEDDLFYLDEIDCRDLFDGENQRERIMIFSMGGEEDL